MVIFFKTEVKNNSGKIVVLPANTIYHYIPFNKFYEKPVVTTFTFPTMLLRNSSSTIQN